MPSMKIIIILTTLNVATHGSSTMVTLGLYLATVTTQNKSVF